MKTLKIKVKTKNSNYPIILGSGLTDNFKKLLNDNKIKISKCLLVIDNKIPKKIINKIFHSLSIKQKYKYFFKASEKNKNQLSVNKILEILLKKNFHRNDCLVSIGGGITGDVSGFVSSIYKRGIKFVNVPTTLLAQVDSSIGGKTGINSNFGKNLIGSFYQPSLVISDIKFLKTLPKREIICGYGEILKHALISNKKFFYFLNKNAFNIINLKSPYIQRAIKESCVVKRNIIQKDEKEKNIRKVLNLGHTFAHAYEASLKYSKKLNHGEAVLLGIISAAKFSQKNNLLSIKDYDLIKNHLKNFKLPINIKKYFAKKDIKKIISFIKNDKKNIDKNINLVLLRNIGKPIYNLKFSDKKISFFLKRELIN